MAQAVNKLATKIPALLKATQSKLQPSLSNFMRYAKVELAPPSTSDIPAIQKSFANIIARSKNGKYNTLTVKEAAVNTLVVLEVACWFFVGEVIGRGSLIGYQIPGTYDFVAHI